jgi:hypothetical protein
LIDLRYSQSCTVILASTKQQGVTTPMKQQWEEFLYKEFHYKGVRDFQKLASDSIKFMEMKVTSYLHNLWKTNDLTMDLSSCTGVSSTEESNPVVMIPMRVESHVE